MTPKALRDAVAELREFVASDGVACTYQSLGQYRSAVLRQIDALLALLPGEGCRWFLYDDDANVYRSGCGEDFQFTDDGPEANGFRFCHGCGKPIEMFTPPTDAPDGERR